MAIKIEKRTRVAETDQWGSWSEIVNEYPPYTDTTLIEFRYNTDNTLINIEDITSNVVVTNSDDGIVTGDGYLDDLMETANTHLRAQHDAGRITGTAYASAYVQLFQSTMNQAIRFGLTKRTAELQADKLQKDVDIAAINEYIADNTKEDKIDVSGYKREVEEVTRAIAVGTEGNKIALVGQQLAKLTADTSYVSSQEQALEEQVVDNRIIKAIDTLGDTYGTFGAGGITVNADQWATYYNLVDQLTSVTTGPIDTSTITKVT